MPIFARNADLTAAQSTPPNWPVNWFWGGPTTVAGGGGGGGPFNPPPWPPGQNPQDAPDIDGDPGTPTNTDERDPSEGPLSNYADKIAVVAPTNVTDCGPFTLTATYQSWTGITDTGHDGLGMTISAVNSSNVVIQIKQTSGGAFANSINVTPVSGVFTASDIFLNLTSQSFSEVITITVTTTTVNTDMGATATYKPRGTDTSIFIEGNGFEAVTAANTKLLAHMDGSNGGTTFTDDSQGAKSMTAVNGATTSTSTFQFSTASGSFDGVNDRVILTDTADFDFGTGDFTVDLWFNTSASDGYMISDGSSNLNIQESWLMRISSGKVQFLADIGSTAVGLISSSSFDDGTWHHAACTKSGSVGRLFVDGFQVATRSDWSSGFNVKTTQPTIGASFFTHLSDWSGFYAGNIDEVRIVKGEAIWTANFIVPGCEYKNP